MVREDGIGESDGGTTEHQDPLPERLAGVDSIIVECQLAEIGRDALEPEPAAAAIAAAAGRGA